MKSWRRLNLDESGLIERESNGAVTYPSPYDVPRALRAFAEGRTLVIEFQYIGNETPRRTVPDRRGGWDMKLILGKNSGRLYRVEVDADLKHEPSSSVPRLLDAIAQAISDLGGRERPGARSDDNPKLARQSVESKRRDLMESLAVAGG